MKNKNTRPKTSLGNMIIDLSRLLKKSHSITHKLGENPIAIIRRPLMR